MVTRAIEIETPHGPARAHVDAVKKATCALVLGHGAGGGVEAPDLQAAAGAARDAGFSVALIEQPYRFTGRKAPSPPKQLDAAWLAVIAALREKQLKGLPLIAGGRSLGARVACRTAAETDAEAVLCLAFPVHPPGKPEKSRLEELDAVDVPVLVVQGESDPFGMPTPAKGREIVKVAGNHGLKADLDAVGAAVGKWLAERVPG